MTTAGAIRGARAGRAARPCGSVICVAAVHGLPLNCWRLAVSMSPVRGTSTLPISRTTCGRSLGNRPRALVRSLGSRPNVEGCGGETVLVCMPAADALLEGSSPYAFDHVYEAERLPAVRPASFRRHDEAVVRQRISVGIGQQKATRRRWGDGRVQPVHGHAACRRPASEFLQHTFPATSVQLMKSLPSLWTYDDRHHQSGWPTARSTPIEYSSVLGARISGSHCKLTLGSTLMRRARIVTGGGIEAGHRHRGRTRVKRLQLSGEDALKEPSVTRPQNRATVGTQLCRDTEPRRPQVPRVHRSEAVDNGVGLARLRIDRGQVLTDCTAVVEPHAAGDCQPVANRHGIGRERRVCQGHTADVGGQARDGLKRLPGPVLVPDVRRNEVNRVVLAAFELSADFPLVFGVAARAGSA